MMEKTTLQVDIDQLSRLCPYYLLFDRNLRLQQFGSSASKQFDLNLFDSFSQHFVTRDCNAQVPVFNDLVQLCSKQITLVSANNPSRFLKGVFELVDEEEMLLFCGIPFGHGSLNEIHPADLQNVEEHTGKICVGPDGVTDTESERWRFAMAASGVGVWDWDTEKNKVYFSPLWKSMLGYEDQDITDQLYEWESRVHPDDLIETKERLTNYIIGKTNEYIVEHRLRCKDRTYKWVLTRGTIAERDDLGKPTRIIGTHTDIHQIKKTEVALQQRVRQFQGLSENIPGVIFEYEVRHDGTHGYKYISPAMQKIFGISPANFMDYERYIHPEDSAALHRDFLRSADRLEPFYNESRLILPHRGIVWRSVSCSFSYYTETGGKVFTGLMLDITERKKANEELNESESRLSSLISSLQMGMLVEDENNRVVLANDQFCRLFKLNETPDSLKGIDSSLLTNNHFKHLFRDPDSFVQRVSRMVTEKQLVQNDLLELLDGRIFSRDYIPLYYNNEYKGHLWKFNDITAQKTAEDSLRLSEEKYRSIIANMKLGLMEVDIFERIVFVNQSFCDMCGWELEELIGRKASELFVKNEHIELLESKNEARQRFNGDAYEIAVKNKAGELRWWLISGAPRYSQDGDLIGSIGIHLDITDHKQLEIDLIKAREVAEESTRSKEAFLANMSHEIRTPMNAILGMTNQLSKTNLTSAQQFCLDTINSASENLLVIINDILDLSKIESGKLTLEQIGFDPRDVVKRAMQVLQHKAEEKGLSFTQLGNDEGMAPVLIGDPYRINQILLNIISNAIKFTEKGGVTVSCKVHSNSAMAQALLISVSDTGIGMDEQFQQNLFQKFSQEDASVTRQYGGTGLGMSITKDLINLMGGSITVKSRKGEGTVISFVVEFPKGEAEDLPSREAFKANEGMLALKKILVVDDNEMNRLVATTILKGYGAITLEAGNGKEAVELLHKELCDLVLMDIQMPVMNGFEATGFIRKHISSQLPIVALTANAIKGDNIKCFEAGMNAYVAKPFKEEDLMKIVASQLNINNQINNSVMENNQASAESYYDITDIKTISRGNQDFINKMLKMFVDQTPAHMEEMKLRYEAKDYQRLGEVAHKIKPTIDSMGINSIKTTIREVEKIGKTGVDAHLLPDLLRQIEYALTMAIKAIKKDYQLN